MCMEDKALFTNPVIFGILKQLIQPQTLVSRDQIAFPIFCGGKMFLPPKIKWRKAVGHARLHKHITLEKTIIRILINT